MKHVPGACIVPGPRNRKVNEQHFLFSKGLQSGAPKINTDEKRSP